METLVTVVSARGRLIAEGTGVKEIGRAIYSSVETVRTNHHIYIMQAALLRLCLFQSFGLEMLIL